jgi:DNA sulfur modification protein DndE
LHLHRGIGYLVGDPRLTNVGSLAVIGLGHPPEG